MILELYLQLQTNRKLYYDYREVSFTVTHNEDFMGTSLFDVEYHRYDTAKTLSATNKNLYVPH